MNKRYTITLLLLTFIITSCSDNGNNPEPDPIENTSVYVTNAGNFGDGNGSITRYDPEEGSTLKQAFEDENGRPLAGIIQSSLASDDRMYIVLNSANKIEVVDKQTMESLGTIELSVSPTAVELIDDETAYVSTLDNQADVDSISVVDLSDMEETSQRIGVGNTPRDIIQVGDRVYVSNNGFGYSNKISVIDRETNTLERTITVGTGPSQMLVDNEDRIWVVCNGRVSYDDSTEDVSGSIYVLDGQTGEVLDSIQSSDISATAGYVYRLTLNEDAGEAYLLNNGISVIDMNNYTLSDTKLTDRSFGAIGYFAAQDRIYVGQSNGWTQSGQALLYDLEGTAVDSFSTGIAPNDFQFINTN